MTTLKLPHSRARQNARESEHNIWYRHASGVPGRRREPDPQEASNRIHDGFARVYPTPLHPMSERRFFTIGSCFARAVEGFLLKRGARVLSADETPYMDAQHLFRPVEVTSNRIGFLNRYNLPSMLQELRILLNGFPADDPNWLLYENGGNWCDLHYGSGFYDISLNECHERRAILNNHLGRALVEANTYVLTLGLCEAWFDRHAQSYLNITPPPRVTASDPDRFEFHFVDYEDNLRALTSIYESLSKLKRDEEFELIVTVSPVPLHTTFTSSDIVVANTEAKAILRAVAGEAARRFPRVTYFPSYEIVMHSNPSGCWQHDRIHVQLPMSAHVVATFMTLLGPNSGADGSQAPELKTTPAI